MTTMSALVEAAARMAEAASAWLDALAPEQRARATFDFEDVAERTSWAYFPRNHRGLPLLEMNPPQQKRAHALIARGLSRHATAKSLRSWASRACSTTSRGGERTRCATPGATS